MANQSIYKAFERMWAHITGTFATKTELANINIDDVIYAGDEGVDASTAPLNADTLGGKDASEYATKEYVEQLLGGIENGTY